MNFDDPDYSFSVDTMDQPLDEWFEHLEALFDQKNITKDADKIEHLMAVMDVDLFPEHRNLIDMSVFKESGLTYAALKKYVMETLDGLPLQKQE